MGGVGLGRRGAVLAVLAFLAAPSSAALPTSEGGPHGSAWPLLEGEATCVLALKVATLGTQAGCFVDTPRRGATGKARFRCRGGETKVDLGGFNFKGTVAKGRFEATASSEFTFEDGCVWRTTQSLTGRVGDGELDYAYRERVVKSDGACASPCTAKGAVAIVDGP